MTLIRWANDGVESNPTEDETTTREMESAIELEVDMILLYVV